METLLIIGLLVSFFLSGFFETFLVKKCDRCGKSGKTKSTCWHYAGLPEKFRPGVIHTMLCNSCYNDYLSDVGIHCAMLAGLSYQEAREIVGRTRK